MTICCTNRKGGVGKTSVAGNMAYELAQTHRTVIVDADAQGSLSSWLLNPESVKYELVDVLYERCGIDDALIEIVPGLWILPTTLKGELRKYAENEASSEPYAFVDLSEQLENHGFQFVVVDLAPGLNTFEQSVIASMDRALLILEPEFLSVDGLSGLLDDISQVIRKRRSTVRYDWIVINSENAGFRRHKKYIGGLTKHWTDYRLFHIKQSSKVSEAQTVHRPLAVYAPNDERALPGYRELSEALRGEYGK